MTKNTFSSYCFDCVVIIVCAFVATLSGCKSIQTQENIQYKDSTIYHYHYDTLHTTITDTLHIRTNSEEQSSTETEIIFADGGTYNAQTGEALNVQTVRTTEQVKILQNLVLTKQTIIEQQANIIDSLNSQISSLQNDITTKQNTTDIKPSLNGWQRFIMGSGYVLWGIIIILLIILIVKIIIKFRGL